VFGGLACRGSRRVLGIEHRGACRAPVLRAGSRHSALPGAAARQVGKKGRRENRLGEREVGEGEAEADGGMGGGGGWKREEEPGAAAGKPGARLLRV
jgi:hypothetical protein